LNPRQPLLHIHSAQKRLIEAGLELVGHEQNLVLLNPIRIPFIEGFADRPPVKVRVLRLAGL
jgi:hypothetical protein